MALLLELVLEVLEVPQELIVGGVLLGEHTGVVLVQFLLEGAKVFFRAGG